MRCRRPSAASSTKSMPSNKGCPCGSTSTQEKRNTPWCSSTPLLIGIRAPPERFLEFLRMLAWAGPGQGLKSIENQQIR